MFHRPTKDEPYVDPRDVQSGVSGTMFMILSGQDNDIDEHRHSHWECRFMRVRVVMGQMNMQDVQEIATYARWLMHTKQPFISFACGRDTPYPEYPGDAQELMRDVRSNAEAFTAGGKKLTPH